MVRAEVRGSTQIRLVTNVTTVNMFFFRNEAVKSSDRLAYFLVRHLSLSFHREASRTVGDEATPAAIDALHQSLQLLLDSVIRIQSNMSKTVTTIYVGFVNSRYFCMLHEILACS